MSPEIKGCLQLRSEVIDRDLCSLCGACVGMCPYLVAHQGRVVALDDCNIAQGRCYAFCPRTPTDLNAVSAAVFEAELDTGPIGAVKEVMMTRAARDNVRARSQYGGTVSALVGFALERGLLDAAVLTASDRRLLPGGVLVREAAKVIDCARSNYVAAPTLAAFNREAGSQGGGRVGVVATPCQTLALGKMRASPLENRNNVDKLGLVVGIFCTWALRYQEFARFLEGKVPVAEAAKFDIPPPPANIFHVFHDAKTTSIPLDDIRQFIRQTCTICMDMTAEFADLSVGAAEGVDGWNTLIVRSDRAAELVAAARAAAVIEADPLPEANSAHLQGASLGKRRRALANIVQMSGSDDDLMYLNPSRDARKRLAAE